MYSVTLISKVIKSITNRLFLYPGGTIAPLLLECQNDGVALIVAKTEQAAGYMAISDAKLNNTPAFVAVTSGPGATNIITCIADAYYDSVPIIVFTGQVGTKDLMRSAEIRQRGFQEVPIADMVKKIVKKAYQPFCEESLKKSINDAIIECMSGRKGPVLIDLPMDVQQIPVDNFFIQNVKKNSFPYFINYDSLSEEIILNVYNFLSKSQKPVILIGGGVNDDWLLVREWLTEINIPVVSSLRGIGVISEHPYIGWIGHTGSPLSNKIVFDSDTILVLGSRLDVRQTGSEVGIFDKKNIIHVDLDDCELRNSRLKTNLKINSSVKNFIESFKKHLSNNISFSHVDWWSYINLLSNKYKYDDIGKVNGISPLEILSEINKCLYLTKNNLTYITTGVGSHQQWVSRYIDFDNSWCRLFSSTGHGTMGYGLPSALGLAYLNSNARVICIDGDGSFQMNLQELALIKDYNINLKILLLDNQRLGIVSQFQKTTFGDDPTTGVFKGPDYSFIAKAYGISYYLMQDELDNDLVLKWFNNPGSCILHVMIQHDAPVSPMLMSGQTMDNMWFYNS